MTMQGKVNIWSSIQADFNHMQTNSTTEGAILDFGFLFKNLKTIPSVNKAIVRLENKIAEEDKTAFEEFEKAVEWVQYKIKSLLPFLSWNNDSWEIRHVHSLLEYQLISLGTGGYLSALIYELKRVASKALEDQIDLTLFEGWTKLGQLSSGELGVLEFHFSAIINQELNKPRLQEQSYQWKGKADTSLSTLYRFLKMLTLYDSFSNLTLSTDPFSWVSPKNLQELEDREYQIQVGQYLNLFKSSDINTHPFDLDELCRLVRRFAFMLEREIESDASLCKDTESSKEHWRTKQHKSDAKTLIPLAKNLWKQELSNCQYPMKLGVKQMAKRMLENIPKTISLHCASEKQCSKACTALKLTDPRIFKDGKYIGLQPLWENFDWVKF